MRGRRAAFIDRDGVLNAAVVRSGRPHAPASVDDVHILPGAHDACHRLVAKGWTLVIVTNQPDIARGLVTRADVEAINEVVTAGLGVTGVMVCPHDDRDGCTCRKPAPGMILGAADRWNLDPARSVMIGDRWRDIEAGRRAGTSTIFVDHHYHERQPIDPDHVVTSLAEAERWLTRAGQAP